MRAPFRSVPVGTIKAISVAPEPTASTAAHDDANAGREAFGHFSIQLLQGKAINMCASGALVRDNWVEALCRASGAPIVDREALPAARPSKEVDATLP